MNEDQRNDPVNCFYCGRDTQRSSGMCWRCTNQGAYQFSDERGRHRLKIDGDSPSKTLDLDAEDDYSEESTPDSICIEGQDLKHFQGRKPL